MGNWGQVQRQAEIQQLNKPTTKKRGAKCVARWKAMCLKRDGYQCLLCGGGDSLVVHHIERWVDSPSKRLKKNNGATLCEDCHKKHHGPSGDPFPESVTRILKLLVSKKLTKPFPDRPSIILYKMNRCLTMPELGD